MFRGFRPAVPAGSPTYLRSGDPPRRGTRCLSGRLPVLSDGQNMGIGKPEPLRHEWAGWWSRRITQEHRLVYRVSDDGVEIAVCRFHYGK